MEQKEVLKKNTFVKLRMEKDSGEHRTPEKISKTKKVGIPKNHQKKLLNSWFTSTAFSLILLGGVVFPQRFSLLLPKNYHPTPHCF
jgi:hypothetical protein